MSMTKTTTSFDPGRAFFLLRNRFLDELPILAIAAAVVAANNLIGLVLAKRVMFNEGQGLMWPIVIIGGGLLLSAQAFKGMHDGKSGSDWLLLPASPLEKYATAAFDYLVVYPLLATALAMGLSALFQVIASLTGCNGGRIWTPAGIGGFKAWLQYGVVASVLLAGSASFRKAPFIKTLAIVSVYALVMAGLFALVGWLFMKGSGYASFHGFEDGKWSLDDGTLREPIEQALVWICKGAWYGLVPVFSLLYGYFRVFEKEARDEVQ